MSIVNASVRWFVLGLVLLACRSQKVEGTPAVVDAGHDAGAEDDVEAVYPVEPNAAPEPLAEKLCAALSELPEQKRAACCSTAPGIVTTAECTRTLSAALRHGAVAVDSAAVDACVAAFDKTLEGCEWVGPFPPAPPAACQGLVKGKLGAGRKCRSSLECAAGLRCKGVGPTTPGTCGPPKAVRELCGSTVDTLAGYTRQTDEKDHPECATGHCIKHRCADPIAAGEPCTVTSDCAAGLSCLPQGPRGKVCLEKPLPKGGEPCPGGACQEGLSCISGKCATRRRTGETCKSDFECRGGCLKPDGGVGPGTCGPRCDVR